MKKNLVLILIVLMTSAFAEARIAPTFHGELVSGERTSLSQYLKPKRALLLCFWASWCLPCLEELRLVKAKLEANPDYPLDVLTVNIDDTETKANVKGTVRQQHITFPIILDPQREIYARYKSEVALPFSALINSNGTIVDTFDGFHESLFATIDKSLNLEKKGPADEKK